jgi:hypothetical protein
MTKATVAWDQTLFAIREDVHARWEWYNPGRELLRARFSQAEVIKRRRQHYPLGDDAAPTWQDINPLACIDDAIEQLLEHCEKPVPSEPELQALLLIAVSLFFSDETDYGLPWGNLPWGRAVTGERTASFGYSRDTAADIAEKKHGDRLFRTVERAWYRLEQGRRAALQPVADAPGGRAARTAPNTFRIVFPHRTLPPWIQDALWNACQLVAGNQEQFRGLVERLDLEYSAPAVLARLLAHSKREFRLAVWDLRHPQERSFTFPRRMALRATNPRIPRKRRLKWLQRFYSVQQLAHITPEDIVHLSHHPEQVEDRLVELTLKEAEFGGWRLENDKLIQPNDSRARGVPIDRNNSKTVWRALDQLYMERRKELREERRERDAQCHREALDRAFRLRLAVKDAIESDLVAGGNEQTQAQWVILLACLLSYPNDLSLPGEFGSWPWKGQGGAYDVLVGGAWIPGRESVLFSPFCEPREAGNACITDIDVESFASLVQHASGLCENIASSRHATMDSPSPKLSETSRNESLPMPASSSGAAVGSLIQSKEEETFTWVARAMFLVREHPDWSDAEIARRVEKNPGTLSRNELYKAAANLARGNKSSRAKGEVIVDSDSGQRQVEAKAPEIGPMEEYCDRGQPIFGSKYFREYCVDCSEPIKVQREKVGTPCRCDRCAQ